MQKAAKADSLFLYRNRANLFFLRNLGDPLTTLAELRHWFGTIRQPSREQVKRAMILTVDEDYSIKAGGGAIADNMFSSSLKWLQAHPVTGEDYEPVIIKKFSDRFEDVLITLSDIEFLIEKTLTDNQIRQQQIEDIQNRVASVCHATASGTIRKSEKGQPAKLVPFTDEFRQLILSRIDTEEKKAVAFAFIEQQKTRLREHIEWVSMPGHGILGNGNTVCPVRTALYVEQTRQHIRRYESIAGELQGNPVPQLRQGRSHRVPTAPPSQLYLFA